MSQLTYDYHIMKVDVSNAFAIATGTEQGASAMLFYLLAYTLATFGAFAVIVVLSRGDSAVTTDDVGGLWLVRPWLALAMAVFMFAMLGFPIVGGMGFFAKWYVLKAALQAPQPQTLLAVVLVLTTVISAGYYLYIIMVMFMRPRREDAPAVPDTPGWTRLVMVASAATILILGVLPDLAVRYAAVGTPRLSAPSDMTGVAPSPTASSFR